MGEEAPSLATGDQSPTEHRQDNNSRVEAKMRSKINLEKFPCFVNITKAGLTLLQYNNHNISAMSEQQEQSYGSPSADFSSRNTLLIFIYFYWE